MFSGVKRKAAASVATIALAGSLAGVMALEQAAPAEAIFFLPLLPIAGATFTGGTVTAGGAAVGMGFMAALGGAIALSDPEKRENFVDWLMEPVDLLGRPIDQSTGQEKDEKKTITEQAPIITGCSTSACADFPWVNDTWRYDAITTVDEAPIDCAGSACSTTRGIRVGVTFKGQTERSGGRQWAYVMAKYACQQPGGARVHKEVAFPIGTGLAYANYDQNTSSTLRCTPAEGHIQQLVLSPMNRDQMIKLAGQTEACMVNGPKLCHGGPPATISYDPERSIPAQKKFIVEVQCQRPDKSMYSVKAEAPYTADTSGVNAPSCGPDGKPLTAKIDQYDGTSNKGTVGNLAWDQTAGSDGSLMVRVDGKPCEVGSPACASWPGLYASNPSRVQCTYAGAPVTIDRCGVLEGAYIWGGTPAVRQNIDGNPTTWVDPASIPGWVPHTVTPTGPKADPTIKPGAAPTASPQPDISNDPQPQPGSQPSPQPSPSPSSSPGGQPGGNTGTETGTIPQSGTNPNGEANPSGENCFGASWSWNPLDWVMTPVKCAIHWAFVPKSQSIQQNYDRIKPKIEAKGIGPLIIAMEDTVGGLPGESGCTGPAINLQTLSPTIPVWYPFQACNGPMQVGAVVVKAVLTLVLGIAGAMGVIRGIAAGFNYKFDMGKDVDV